MTKKALIMFRLVIRQRDIDDEVLVKTQRPALDIGHLLADDDRADDQYLRGDKLKNHEAAAYQENAASWHTNHALQRRHGTKAGKHQRGIDAAQQRHERPE